MRADEIGLDQAQALAVSDDHAAQLRVWTEAQGYWMREPRAPARGAHAGGGSMRDRLAQLVELEPRRPRRDDARSILRRRRNLPAPTAPC